MTGWPCNALGEPLLSLTSHCVARPLHLWLWKWKVQSWMDDFPQNTLRILAGKYCCNVERTSHTQQPVALAILDDCMSRTWTILDTISCDLGKVPARSNWEEPGSPDCISLHRLEVAEPKSSNPGDFCSATQVDGKSAWRRCMEPRKLNLFSPTSLNAVFFLSVKWIQEFNLRFFNFVVSFGFLSTLFNSFVRFG